MEIMLLAVVSPEIRCEWRLEDWQVALVSTVSALVSTRSQPSLQMPSIQYSSQTFCANDVPKGHIFAAVPDEQDVSWYIYYV